MSAPNSSRVLFGAAIILGALAGYSVALGNSTANEERLRRKVIAIYTASRRAIQSVECAYVDRLNGMERRCFSARSEDKFYHASVDILPKGRRGLPREVAWDGQTATFRGEIGELIRGRSIEIASTTCDTPDLTALVFVDQTLGYRPEPKHRFKFRSARELRTQGGDCIELHFDMESTGGTVMSRHARDLGYLPVSVLIHDKNGRIAYELEEIIYERRERDGNALFYPVRSVSVSYVDGKPANRVVVEVDKSTLRINERIDPARFVLEPWPIDTIYDADTQKATARSDPTWLPVGKVGFPWDVYLESQPPSQWAADLRARFSPSGGQKNPSGSVATGDATSAQPLAAQAAAAPIDAQAIVWWIVLASGGLLVVGAIIWNLRQRRKTG